MKQYLLVSAMVHVVAIGATHFLGHRLQMIQPAEFIDVSLVAGPASVQPAARPAAPPAPKEEEVAEKVFPDVSDRPGAKREREKRVEQKEKQAEKKPEKKPARKPPTEREQTTSRRTGSDEDTLPRADVSGSGTADKGSTLGGVRVDNVDFQFAYYLSQLRNKLASHWSPGSLAPGSPSRIATVYFRISRDGSIHEVSIEESSGNSFFDQSVMRAVHAASPLAPLPFSFGGTSLGVHVDFNQTP